MNKQNSVKLMKGSSVRFLINKFHCIKSAHRLKYSLTPLLAVLEAILIQTTTTSPNIFNLQTDNREQEKQIHP